jgi:tight adherence protein B
VGPNSAIIIYILIFAAAVLAMHSFIGMGKHAAQKIKWANDRMKYLSMEKGATAVLTKLHTRRGMTGEGELKGVFIWIKKLILHSGLPLGQYGFYLGVVGLTLGLSGIAYLLKGSVFLSLLAFCLGLAGPVFALLFLVIRRQNNAVRQLPDAIDIIVRSLSAGHPVPVAMSLVGREMADPIGTEFGVASDEITYGATVSQSAQRLSDRVGHEDFDLFAAMIRLQERTGGNLAELLRNSAGTIRDRQKMRLKIKAASAEGRMSAMILNIAPIALFCFINLAAPDFYGEIKGNKITNYFAVGVISWMVLGNLVMRKMINFKI